MARAATPDEMLTRLQAFVAEQLPGAAPEISGLVKTSVGRSRENWAFDVAWQANGEERREPLMLRCDPPGGLVETDRATEFAILRALEGTAVPTPAARWLDSEGRWFGRPSLVMHREAGACEYHVLSGSRPLDERVGLAQRFCDLLAAVHTADWRATGLGQLFDDKGEAASLAELDHWESVLRRDQREPYPELDLGIDWLRANAPRAQATVLVHGDFKPGNVLLDGDRIVALLDWELAHLGDPMEDLGWVTQPLRRREHIIPGAWEDAELFQRYERATGFTVDEDSIRWWNTFATFRTAVMQVSGLRSFLEGRSDEPYRPTARVLRSILEAVEA
jgi:aminoglycoside phosphotransferase (APT) family kinase protein